jgi:arylsulfatase A-like enzyme
MSPRFLVLAILALSALAAPAAPPMNVLVIQTDEHNFRTLGCYRKMMPKEQAFVWGDGVKVDTPNIDWLAENGAICDRYYATAPVCTPSRASLISGLYPQNTGAIKNNNPLGDHVVTFAEILKRKGYSTGYAGKWHLEGPRKPGWAPPENFGFDDNRYMFNRGHWKKLELTENGPRVGATDKGGKPSYGLDGADEKTFTTDWLADRTIEFIRTNKGKPFCYMVAIPDPHGPNTVRAPYDTMFDPEVFKEPASALAKADPNVPAFQRVMKARFNARQMALYFGMVACIDDNIGQILDELRAQKILDRTLIVFTSDHGDMCGELGRHNKGIPCEGSARIPFILHAPGLVKPGTHVPHALGTVDFKPTLLGLLGVPFTEKCEGRDASPLFGGENTPEGWEDVTFVRMGDEDGMGNWFGAFTREHKLVISHSNAPGFFDLVNDPMELKNGLAEPKNRAEIRRLAKALKAYGEQYAEPQLNSPRVQADLEWAIGDSPTYDLPARPPAKGKGKGKKKAA